MSNLHTGVYPVITIETTGTITVSISHTHTTVLCPFFQDHPGEPVTEENFFWTFMVEGKITEADTPTIWLGATPSGLISDAPLSFPVFYTRYPSCHNAPNLSWLGTGTKYAGLHIQCCGISNSININLNERIILIINNNNNNIHLTVFFPGQPG